MTFILWTGGEGPSFEEADFLIKKLSLLKTTEIYHVCADSGFDSFLDWKNHCSNNILPEFIAGDFDSSSSLKTLEDFKKKGIIVYSSPRDKDYSDTELCMLKIKEIYSLKRKSKKEELNLILFGGGNGRIDHFISILDLFCRTEFIKPLLWLYRRNFIFMLKKNKNYTLESFTENQNISFSRLPSSWKKGRIESFGLEWEGKKFRKNGFASLSNRPSKEALKSGKISIKVKGADFLLISGEPIFVFEN